MPFEFKKLEIPEVILVKFKDFKDSRGRFMETYKSTDFHKFGIKDNFIQDNHSVSTKGVIRGLHYQILPKAMSKLVRCTRGKIIDFAIDIRKGSPTYSKWVKAELSEDNNLMLYIPVGFAHAFYVLSDVAEVLYKTSEIYSPEHSKSILWNDPEININLEDENPIVSEQDKYAPLLKNAENNFYY